jgi:hypothetical protein
MITSLQKSGSRTGAGAGAEELHVRSESVKSVSEDHESTKTGGVTDTGVEEPKARSESAKSIAEGDEAAKADSVRSRESVAETVREDGAKSPSDD